MTAEAESKLEGSLRARPRVTPGLRVQILLALAGVMLVAYVPLFFAIAQVTRANSLAYREESARTLGRAVAAHVGDVVRTNPHAVPAALQSHVGEGGAIAIAVYGSDGAIEASAGAADEIASLRTPPRPYGEAATRASTHAGARAMDVVLPAGESAVLVRVRSEEDAARTAGVVRGIALYMGVFALALLVFAYIALTRAIVKPIEQLAGAADRVAKGARALEVPSGGAREIAELGASVRSMASRLLADEEAMRLKVDELTTTTRHLGETREQLEGSERMASVGRLAAGVAHEIGNPIAAIMGMHDLIDDADIPQETRDDFLRRMRKETERIHVVVRDLLDYARPEPSATWESGPPSTRPAVADVADVVADAIALVKPQKEWRGVEVTIDVASGLRVALSPQRLTQVLLNLLLNAAAALSQAAPDRPHTLTVRARRDGARARVEVEDDGPGVPAELRDRIFDPFVTTKEVGAGTGLGLSVCRGIVEGASGRIFVDPDHDAGARFVVELPAVD
ncbi:MAG: HAMP domain-containing histidine kinase [Labilithrix sp.]|nr:HAMP domain-containing histidine kinase [Labilithrix sp.]